MASELLKEIAPNVFLYRDSETGIAWVVDGNTVHAAHPSIDRLASIQAMKLSGRWKRSAQVVFAHGRWWNTSWCSANLAEPFDVLAMEACQCGGTHHEVLDQAA